MQRTAGSQAVDARLFLIEFDLRDYSSHFFNQALGFKVAAEEAGLVPHILLPKDTASSLAKPLNGHCVIEFDDAASGSFEFELDAFSNGHRQLEPLWAILESMAISQNDIVLITSGRPVVIYSLGAWLGRIARANRPAVYIRFFNRDYLNAEATDFSERSWSFRFAARDLSLRSGQDRVFFTVNNEDLAEPLGRLCARRVFWMPLPKHYGDVSYARSMSGSSPVIYVHMNARCGIMLQQIQSVLRGILDQRPNLKVLLKYCRNALAPGIDAKLSSDLALRGAELIPTEQSHADYLDTIARSDIILLPYDVFAYRAVASGVFAEGAALGKVMVCPAQGWMAKQIADRRAAGISFGATNQAQIDAAVLQALDCLAELRKSAVERSHTFRSQHNCRQNLDLMLKLASESHDMSFVYVLGRTIKFAELAARDYLGRGWSQTEPSGVWTDGAEAQLLFRIEPHTAGPLDVWLRLTPFVAAGYPQCITFSVNGVKLGEWKFSDDKKLDAVRFRLAVPAYLARGKLMNIHLRIDHPRSPKEFTGSKDIRLLGVMLHEVTIDRAQ
jgi:hypothetical protein